MHFKRLFPGELLVSILLALGLAACETDGASDIPQTRADAVRFLNQASFGPDEKSIDRLMTIGYEAWIDEQFAMRPAFTFKDFYERRDAEIKADSPNDKNAWATGDQALEAFYTRALTDPAQLRMRVMFALSEIFVVSYMDDMLNMKAPAMVIGHMDVLDNGVDGTYRQLLESVSKSPAMGHYLTFRGNTREVPALGHYPDENYAREVMQLFSIGLYELNQDGTRKLNDQGQPIETYTSDDIRGLAKVFTGWGNYRGSAYASQSEFNCFVWASTCQDYDGFYHPMVPYQTYHSITEKKFLGTTIAADANSAPQADLTRAMDTLASHANTAPFISKQLIQRFVTSNPSPEYVGRVAAKFLATGGSIKEVVKAILLDDEARGTVSQLSPDHGKLREPILRMTALLRAFKMNFATSGLSASPLDKVAGGRLNYVTLGNTSDSATSLGQAPMYSPSVFNFFRPGYTPPQSTVASRGLVAPEMQLLNESTVTGYVNAVLDVLSNGIGPARVVDTDGQCGAFTAEMQQYIAALDAKVAANKAIKDAAANCKLETLTRRSVSMDLTEQRSLAYDTAALTQHIADRLTGGALTDGLRQLIVTALETVTIPALNAQQSNGADINSALDKRVMTAIAMVAVSPEFLITK